MPVIDDWCRRWLGSGAAETLFVTGHLSRVAGVRLEDGREVAIKVRAAAPRLRVCTAVQKALWEAGFPCPEPLVGPVRLGGYAATAETLVAPGGLGPEVSPYAELLARLLSIAPPPSAVGSLAPHPPWTAWDHAGPVGSRPSPASGGLWPPPDDRDGDLNAHPSWLDEVGSRARRRLSAHDGAPVIGHGDWEAHNVGEIVLDWDSTIAAPEAVIVGLAAAVWVSGLPGRSEGGATVDESQAFLDAYQGASGRPWTADEIGAAWAAGLWVRAFNAKKAELDSDDAEPRRSPLTEAEAAERLRLAAA
ncbi:hypothetical protein JIG36_13025 [Actinoplanes sp. LDG1-06]|uniref:Aminoglycoside phosphotransferase domain-containing protein n=1 Tax=Paractinoplanes ovalisporus TaxID=2810368 RepID=A0ABS2A9H1_9ACTN|nr:hypothetical protein [Actinoplanes ovalisporus]MBM2616480.1 hypothetical protein [Actinoplanes ovalisporus]